MIEDEPRRVPLLPLGGLAIILLAAIIAVAVSRGVRQSNHWVAHSVGVQVVVVELAERISAQDAAMRGYDTHPDPRMMQEFRDAQRGALSRLAMLRIGIRDNPVQMGELDRVEPLIKARLRYALQRVTARDRAGIPLPFKDQQMRARLLSRVINQRLHHMFDNEQQLVARRQHRTEMLIESLSIGLVATVVLVVVVAYLTINDARRRFDALRQAHEDARFAEEAMRLQMKAREEVEGQLRQVQKMESIGQLTGGIAHDFNNMLAVITGSLDLARRHLTHPGRVGRHLDSAASGAERAGALVTRLLAFSRRQPLAPEPLDVNALVAGMTDLLARTLGERVQVRTELGAHVWRSYADPLQLENAILNLAVNARDAMPNGGTLVIGTANMSVDSTLAQAQMDFTVGDYVTICVADDGAGMSDEIKARAFDPFFTTKSVGKGTGLGLSQVFGFAKQSGGHVDIESSPGLGSAVRIFLPRHDQDGPAPIEERPSAVPIAPVVGEVVLVVEDDPRVRDFSMEALRELGYSPIAAPDSTSAVDLAINTRDLALVFTDVVMPGMTGPELGAAVRARRPDIKILYTTGYAREGFSQPGMLTPDMAVLPKPFTLSQLAAKLRETIDG